MAGQTYDPYAVFADAPGPTPDLSHIPTAQLQALLDARNASAAPPAAGLFDDLIPNAAGGQPQPAGASAAPMHDVDLGTTVLGMSRLLGSSLRGA